MKTRNLGPSTALLMSIVSASALWAAAGCTATVGDASGGQLGLGGHSTAPGTGGTPTSGLGGGSGAAGGGTVVPIPQIDITQTTKSESAGPLMMRRLTYREYDHMMTQLLGDTTSPASGANGWTGDAPAMTTGFVTPNTVARYQVIQYDQTASTLVDNAITAMSAGQKTGKFVLPSGCAAPTAAQEGSCATKFIANFGLSAFRRPVSSQEQTDLMALFTAVRTTAALSFVDSIGALAKAMLESPNFLYHWEIGPTTPVAGADGLLPLTQWQIASRLASAIWESMPDDILLSAAQNGQLSTQAQVAAQVQRMLADPQAAQSLYNFHLQWYFNMGFTVTDLASVDAKANSPLTKDAAKSLQTEFTQFILSVYAPPGDGTLKTLYTAPYAFVNKDLAAIYGVTGPDTGFAKVALDPSQRAGIFTQVSFLAGIELSVADNPVYRGLAIYTKALCGTIPPPPMMPPPVVFKDGATTRQGYDVHGKSECAKACHARFDPAGFAFENYDGAGRYRTTDNNQAVDATGTFESPAKIAGMAGTTFKFNNAVELAQQLAASPDAQACIARQWSRYLLGHAESEAEIGSLQVAYHAGASTPGFSIRDMLTSLLTSKAFMFRQRSDGEPM